MKQRAGLFGILIMIATFPAGAVERMTLRVTPALAFAPVDITVRAMVEVDAGNRGIAIIAESADFYRSSQVQLDGDHAPRTTTFEFRGLPPGRYQVKAILFGVGGKPRATVSHEVSIFSSNSREP